MEQDLQELRGRLDAIDRELTGLFVRRMETVRGIAEYKRAHGLPVLDGGREAEVLDRAARTAGGDLAPYARRLYGCLLRLSRDRQRSLRGEAGEDARNIVLIGMPSCGKTTVGRALAARLGRPFADLDEAVEAEEGMPIPEIFAAKGDKYFREAEARLAARLARMSGAVIATGGGTVLRAENVEALRQNGVTVWLRRPVELLTAEGRPLSVSRENLRKMEAERLPFYAGSADLLIDNTDTVDAAAERIAAVLEALRP